VERERVVTEVVDRAGAPPPSKATDAVLFGLLPAAALLVGAVVGLSSSGVDLAWLSGPAADAWAGWFGVVTNPWYAGFLVALGVLQWRFPARRELPGLSVGLGQDLAWFLFSTALSVSVVAGWLTLLDRAYGSVTGGWSLDLGAELGTWGLPLLALIVTDLIAWTSHYLHHKVPALWAFHAVHHAQEQMNVLSDSRQHVVETAITTTMVFVPARVLGLDAAAASGLAFLSIYVGAFIHANIRTNLGPARFLLISPQAHRVHHSAAPEHIDTNFGVILAAWDHLFGTRYGNDDEYPTTGIHDRSFPLERSARPAALVATWARQCAYPFRVLSGRHAESALAGAASDHEAVAP
jgi:sterol desaturase/sphingolipid hydroxylase (fatty acid hydroxylase superfamily)